MKKTKTVKMLDIEAGSLKARVVMAVSVLFTGRISLPLAPFKEYMKSQHIGD